LFPHKPAWHACPVEQTEQLLPPPPQAFVAVPATHEPVESQQPVAQLDGPHFDSLHDGIAAIAKPITKPTAHQRHIAASLGAAPISTASPAQIVSAAPGSDLPGDADLTFGTQPAPSDNAYVFDAPRPRVPPRGRCQRPEVSWSPTKPRRSSSPAATTGPGATAAGFRLRDQPGRMGGRRGNEESRRAWCASRPGGTATGTPKRVEKSATRTTSVGRRKSTRSTSAMRANTTTSAERPERRSGPRKAGSLSASRCRTRKRRTALRWVGSARVPGGTRTGTTAGTLPEGIRTRIAAGASRSA